MAKIYAKWIYKDSQSLEDDGSGNLRVKIDPSGALTKSAAGLDVNSGGITNDMLAGNIALSKLEEAVIQADGGQDFTGDQSMGGNLLTNVGTGAASITDPLHAANKAYVDSLVSGVSWVNPVATIGLVGNASVSTVNGLSPSAGDAYVVTDSGTITSGSISANAGDVVEYDGSQWVRIVVGSGGYVPDGTRLALSTSTALIAPYSDGADDGKIVDFDGTTNTGSNTTEAVDGNAILVNSEGSYNENKAYVYDGTVPSGTWVQFAGPGAINAGAGLTQSGTTMNVGDANKGVQVNTDDLEIDASEIAGNGLQENGSSSWLLEVKPDSTTGGDTAPVSVGVNGVGIDVTALDGDHLQISWVPTNYTRTTSPSEANALTDLTAHLAGIDAAIGALGGGRTVEHFTLSAGDITNGYVDLAFTPTTASDTILLVKGAPNQEYGDDYQMNGTTTNRLEWTGLGLDGVLESGDKLTVIYET